MVDLIKIEKIQNGFIVSKEWFSLKERVKDIHYPTLDGVIKHLKLCFGSGKEDKEQVRDEDTPSAKTG